MHVLRSSFSATIGLVLVVTLVVLALLAPVISPYDPLDQSLADRVRPPDIEHLFGTDRLGRDALSRILWGARLSLFLGVGSTTIALLVGVPLGLVAGYFRGWIDTIAMRTVDILLAFPMYLVALMVVAVLGPSVTNTIAAIAVASSPSFARLARGETLRIRKHEFVEAARSIGAPAPRILWCHVLPNILSPLIVAGSLRVGGAILVEASLSFLGLGPPPPTPSWGLMINDGLQVMRSAFWVPLFPGLAITLTVLGFNLLGDGLRDALDPRLRGDVRTS